MTIRTDSYSSTSEVKAFTRHLLDGQSAFNSTTRPTATELERFIDRASGALNTALSAQGLTTPVTNSTGKLLLDDWVTMQAAMYVEMTQRGVGFNEGEGSRTTYFRGLYDRAADFAKGQALGLKNLGCAVTHKLSDGLMFTGLDAQDERSDPGDTSIEQPLFTRRQFDASGDDSNES